MWEGIVQSKSKTFLAFCFCFLVGVIIASYYNERIDLALFYGFAVALGGLLTLFWKNTLVRFIVLCVAMSLLGTCRYSMALPSVHEWPQEKIEFQATVSAEPDVRQDGVRYILDVHDTPGAIRKMYAKMDLYPRYAYGDVVRIECGLQKPKPIGSFRYDMYLRLYGVDAVCHNPSVEKVGEGAGSSILSTILKHKQSLATHINALWHEPYAGFMAGLLYGYRGGLGALNESFNRTGVTHIVAISGYNITIVATILMIVCTRLFIPRQKAFWLITAGILLFVIFTGASGSVVRAGIMGFLVLLAQQLGRQKRMANVLVFTAVLMVIHNPFVLMWDVGFQLSFLATLGLVYVAPVIQKPFERLPEWLGVRESAVATCAAIISTLPLIMYQFGRVSLVAPIVNILILWIIPWIMFAGFASIVSSVISPLAVLLSWFAWVMMRYVVFAVEGFSALPFASVSVLLPLWFVLFLYILLIFWVRRHYARSVFQNACDSKGVHECNKKSS